MKRLVIFDLDGTILNTLSDLHSSVNASLELHGLPPISESQTMQFVGNGSLNLIKRACGENDSFVTQVHESFLKIYKENGLIKTAPYPKILELIKTLKKARVKMAVFSNKPHFATVDLCNKIFGENTFDYVLGHKENAPLKPDPSGITEILTALKVDKGDALLIGDGETDVKCAKLAQIDFVGALWGFRTKKQLKKEGARLFASDPDDLINIILYYYGRKKMKKFFNEFKKFISKGNVLDMAVGVIIGSAFSAIVNSLVKDVITPIISLATGGVSLSEQVWILKGAVTETVDGVETVITPALTLNYGNFIQAIINFLIIALTVFLFVKVVLAVQKSLDINANMKASIQKKLDADEALNSIEQKWMKRMEKRDPANLPKKTPPQKPAAPAEPSSTDKLLMQILEEMKKKD